MVCSKIRLARHKNRSWSLVGSPLFRNSAPQARDCRLSAAAGAEAGRGGGGRGGGEAAQRTVTTLRKWWARPGPDSVPNPAT